MARDFIPDDVGNVLFRLRILCSGLCLAALALAFSAAAVGRQHASQSALVASVVMLELMLMFAALTIGYQAHRDRKRWGGE